MVLMSAWIPAPPPESEPATTRTLPCMRMVLVKAGRLRQVLANRLGDRARMRQLSVRMKRSSGLGCRIVRPVMTRTTTLSSAGNVPDHSELLWGAIEGGGTKFVCAVGQGPQRIADECRITTREPDATLQEVVEFFSRHP